MYAIVKTGGKQYRVEEGQSLLVERLPVDDGAKVTLQALLYVDGSTVLDGEELSKVKVEAKVLAHERGPKLRIVKFKPKRGYKRRTGHRQELTRLEVTAVKLAARRKVAGSAADKATPKPEAAEPAEAPRVGREASTPAASAGARKAAPKAQESAAPKAQESAAPPATDNPTPTADGDNGA